MDAFEWKQYRRTAISEMRPYVPGEDMRGISVQQDQEPMLGGMIARNPQDFSDQWYVTQEYFDDNLEAL